MSDNQEIEMIGDREYNDEWHCEDCDAEFGTFVQKEHIVELAPLEPKEECEHMLVSGPLKCIKCGDLVEPTPPSQIEEEPDKRKAVELLDRLLDRYEENGEMESTLGVEECDKMWDDYITWFYEEFKKAAKPTREPAIRLDRVWAMPSIWTFKVKPIADLLREEVLGEEWADPFAGFNSPAKYTNDIEEDRPTTYHIDGLEFLKGFADSSLDGVIFDPPYSTEQALRRYTPKRGGTAGRAEYWARCKDEIARIVKPNGKVISMCWDSNGVGKKRGFSICRILLVCHGACHNDTIVTVEVNNTK